MKYFNRLFSCLGLVSCLFLEPSLRGMDLEKVAPYIFAQQDSNTDALVYQIFDCLNEKDLGSSYEVNWRWRNLIKWLREREARYHVKGSKITLFPKILVATGAQANAVQRFRDLLGAHLQEEHLLLDRKQWLHLGNLLERLLQPEALLLCKQDLRDILVEAPSSKAAALAFIRRLLAELQPPEKTETELSKLLKNGDKLGKLLRDIYEYYLSYLNAFDTSTFSCYKHIRPKAILTGEEFLWEDFLNKGKIVPPFRSFRIPQEVALKLVSNDGAREGEILFRKRTVGSKIGMETATYRLWQVFFKRGFAPSALLALNEVDLVVPQEDTHLGMDYAKKGLAYADFCAYQFLTHRSVEKQFTQKCPSHMLQARQAIMGMSLEKFIQEVENGKCSFDDLDTQSFSEQCIMSILTNPSDAGPDKFMVEMARKPYKIICIDGIGALEVLSEVNEKQFPVCNALYCLPLMEKLVNDKVIDQFLQTPMEEVLLRWLPLVSQDEKAYEKLSTTYYDGDRTESRPYLKKSYYSDVLGLPLQFPAVFLGHLIREGKQLQTLLERDRPLTHRQLLQRLKPTIAAVYKTQKNTSLLKAYCLIDERYAQRVEKKDDDILSGVYLRKITGSSDLCISQVWQDLLSRIDILDRSASFLAEAVYQLQELDEGSCKQFVERLHDSWKKDGLLLYALANRISPEGIRFLLNRLETNSLVIDNQNNTAGWSTLRHAVACHYPPSTLYNLYSSAKKVLEMSIRAENSRLTNSEVDHLVAFRLCKWLDSRSNDQRTALDEALLQKNADSFIALVDLGCTTCDSLLVRNFYDEVVTKSNDKKVSVAFTKLLNCNDKLKWQLDVACIFPPSQQFDEEPLIELNNGDKRVLSESVFQKLIKDDGIPHAESSLQVVKEKSPMHVDHGIHCKLSRRPGKEAVARSLIRLLLGYGAPQTILAKVHSSNARVYPLQLSQENGTSYTLKDVLENRPEVVEKFDETAISGLILVTMLLNLRDGGPDKYVVEKCPDGKCYRIAAVTNEYTLDFDAPGMSIVWCFDQMDKPVAPEIGELFSTLDPYELLKKWLQELDELNKVYTRLFGEDERAHLLKEHDYFIGIPLREGTVRKLYDMLVCIKEILTKDSSITHRKLLAKLALFEFNDNVCRKSFFRDTVSPLDRFAKVKSKNDSYKDDTEQYSSTLALQELEKVANEQASGKGLEKLDGWVDLGSDFLQGIEDLDRRELEIYLKKLDCSTATQEEQKSLLGYLKDKNITKLVLKNCTLLDDTFLMNKSLLRQLTKIDLTGCDGITTNSLLTLSKEVLGLKKLILAYIKTLTKIGDLGTFIDAPLVFNALTKLDLRYCNKLWKLLFKAPSLRYLHVANCALDDAMLDGVIKKSPNLEELCVEGAKNISAQEARKKHPTCTLLDIKTAFSNACEKHSIKKYDEAFRLFSIAADNDDFAAQWRLGKMYAKGEGVQKNNKEAARLFQLAVDKGYADAEYSLALFYLDGSGEVGINSARAIELFKKAAEQGHSGAEFALGCHYLKGKHVLKNDSEAIRYFKAAGDKGHADALYSLGLMYEKGLGVEQNCKKAIELYEKASVQFHVLALCNLGFLHARGENGVIKDIKKSFDNYLVAANQGHAPAQYSLALLYESGTGVTRDDSDAVDLLEKAAKQDHPGALYNLGCRSKEGRGVDKNEKKAAMYFEKAANKGYVDAQYHFGLMCKEGKGVNKDSKKAVSYFEKAAAKDQTDAMYNLGFMYEKAEGVERDYNQAFELYKKAADKENSSAKNHLLIFMYEKQLGTDQDYEKLFCWYKERELDARAHYNLGFMYENGLWIEKNTQEAFKEYKSSAMMGDAKGQYKLSCMYEMGIDGVKNYELAFSLCKASADQDDVDAQFSLALLYQEGKGVAQDLDKAAKYYELSAVKGNVKAQYELGQRYENQQKYIESAVWYETAADLGHSESQCSLAFLYANGWGVDLDRGKALKYFQLAANQGNSLAQKQLDNYK